MKINMQEINKGISKMIDEEEEKLINRMLDVMMIQAEVIQDAKALGFDMQNLLPEIKKRYEIHKTLTK